MPCGCEERASWLSRHIGLRTETWHRIVSVLIWAAAVGTFLFLMIYYNLFFR